MPSSSKSENLVDLVEPRLGSVQTRWIAFSSACLPQGMVSLSPDTRTQGDWGCGYVWGDTAIRGFSHIHDWQIGALLVMPVCGEVDPRSGPDGYKSEFSHSDEICKPGDHRVRLTTYGIDVELTATARVGLHRYRFPSEAQAAVILDLAEALGLADMGQATLRRVDDRRVEGSVVNLPTIRRPKPLTVYFAIQLDHPAELDIFAGQEISSVQEITAKDVRARLRLGKVASPVEMRVAVSYTSIQAAWENLHAEAPPTRSFDEVRSAAKMRWNNLLSRIEVDNNDPVRRARLYTDIFFALVGRRTCSDVAGTYIDNTGASPIVRQTALDQTGKSRYRHFNSDSLWGAQWGITQLWALAYPELLDEFCRCFLDVHDNAVANNGEALGLVPRGPCGGNYTFVMTSAQSTPMFAAAIHTGAYQPADIARVYAALRKNHFPGGLMSKAGYEHQTCVGGGIADYMEKGFIPEDLPKTGFHNNGASQTLEHAYNDWALSQLAITLGLKSDAELFDKRSKNYRHLFDRALGFMRPRNRDGSWVAPYSADDKRGWTEANGWTYTFYVPHDVVGLASLFGSGDQFLGRWTQAMEISASKKFIAPHGRHEENTFDFGNEPPLGVPFLPTLVGRGDLTDIWVRRVLDVAKSGNSPTDGYGGDEDQGIMGAWNVLAAIGLFSVDGLSRSDPEFSLHAPAFRRICIHRPGASRPMSITVLSAQETAQPGEVIQEISIDGQPQCDRRVAFSQIARGIDIRVKVD